MIKSKIIADSITKNGERITTFELEFPRWILAEFNTHRQLSRNSASSRAITIESNIDNILNNTAAPVHWGLNQRGMVADNEASEDVSEQAESAWNRVRDYAIAGAQKLSELKIHKQVANRLIENFTYQKVVVTATEWDNFFWLRNHRDAQPEIKVLAELMLDEYNSSVPVELEKGDWHVPYYKDGFVKKGDPDLENSKMISASCCAQVSYRKTDDTLEKANKIFGMLNLYDDSEETRKHASPVEHQATPIVDESTCIAPWSEGITHLDRNDKFWSGNFKGWIQHRHLIPKESCSNNPYVKR